MLAARRELQRHDERIIHLLQHSHGSVDDKYEALDERLAVVFADDAATMSAYHLGAPHRHLMLGFKETRTDVRALTDRASESASLVVSATVGRLLDRSEANKTTGTAVGAALAIIALVSTFTAVASVPSERSGPYLTRLAGWVGFSGLLVGAFVMLLAWVANHPAVEVTFPGRRARRTLGAVVLVGASGSSSRRSMTSAEPQDPPPDAIDVVIPCWGSYVATLAESIASAAGGEVLVVGDEAAAEVAGRTRGQVRAGGPSGAARPGPQPGDQGEPLVARVLPRRRRPAAARRSRADAGTPCVSTPGTSPSSAGCDGGTEPASGPRRRARGSPARDSARPSCCGRTRWRRWVRASFVARRSPGWSSSPTWPTRTGTPRSRSGLPDR